MSETPLTKAMQTLTQDGHHQVAADLAAYIESRTHVVEPDPLDAIREMSAEEINNDWDRVSEIMRGA